MDLSEDIHCFKHSLAAEEFINIINNVSALSKNLGMPVQQLHRYILQKKLELEKVESKTEDAEIKLLQVLQHYNVTMNDLEKCIKNKSLIDRVKQLENQIEKIKRERDYYAQQLRNEQLEKSKLVQQWRMSS
jgi:flagellar biosynthesis chaperone FliJ